MATFNKFNGFTEALAEKVHNLGSDTLTVALTASANAPVATNSQLSNLTQISYTNLSSRVLTTSSSSNNDVLNLCLGALAFSTMDFTRSLSLTKYM